MKRTIPNILTVLRIALLPVFIVVFYLPFVWANKAAAAIFFLICFTDWLDGYLARVLSQTSRFGAFLDPVADKLTVAVALVLLVGKSNSAFMAIPAAIIVSREIVISALREWMAEMGNRASVAVSFVGKFKTLIQMVALFFLIAYVNTGSYVETLAYILFYLAAALTLWSMVVYLKMAWPDLMED